MKSAYQDKEFSDFWNQISGARGQTYKKYVIDPEMFKLLGSIKNKVVLDLGCGNGYLGQVFLNKGAKKIILFDVSRANIDHAKKRCSSPKAEFLCQDGTKEWKIRSKSLDIIFSDMMLNEVKNIKTPIKEAARVLKKGGLFVFAVTHPAWDLFEYAKKKFTGASPIIPKAGPYFFRGYNHFIMSTESLKPKKGGEYKQSYNVGHFQRPIEDYFNTTVQADFTIKKIVEPELTSRLLKNFSGYKEMTEHPIGLIFLAVRN